jgi:hypothetical protein
VAGPRSSPESRARTRPRPVRLPGPARPRPRPPPGPLSGPPRPSPAVAPVRVRGPLLARAERPAGLAGAGRGGGGSPHLARGPAARPGMNGPHPHPAPQPGTPTPGLPRGAPLSPSALLLVRLPGGGAQPGVSARVCASGRFTFLPLPPRARRLPHSGGPLRTGGPRRRARQGEAARTGPGVLCGSS